ncbi:hypothetical protein [Dyella jiangningensis]|uniref:Transmembrane protein n=1 Tax=Dyella jiangningensis TaxID=1379159 RepID=A0A328P6N1_9GAMM|nr:hypothetical protein [Dyella jiangningensis]RAO75914.1 hypothetical protein CA260_17975 [Dyella jiangningensis]
MSRRSLDFAYLEREVSQALLNTADPSPSAVERWSFALGFLIAGIASLVGTLIGGSTGLRIVQVGLVLELAGVLVSVVCFVRRVWGTFAHKHVGLASDLDRDFEELQRVLTWLRTFPYEERSRRLRFLQGRKATFAYRFGLIAGGVERLGVLPVLGLLYLQFKDWEFGDWEALGRVHMVGGLLLWMLLLTYLGAWWLAGLKGRVDLYEILLTEACIEPSPVADAGEESERCVVLSTP